MADFEFSGEQQEILTAPISDMLVSAAAGSGKTTVLVGRIIDEIAEGKLSVDRLLVLTFTNDAAAHMEEKIEEALRKRAAAALSAGDRDLYMKLSEQIDKMPNAYIQTIDSFCSRVLKEKGYLTAPPEDRDVFASANVILDEGNLELILKKAAELAITEMYMSDDKLSEESGFIRLTYRFGDGRSDNDLSDSLVESYKKLRSIPDYLNRVDDFASGYRNAADSGDDPSLANLVSKVGTSFVKIRRALYELEDFCFANDLYPIKKPDKKGYIKIDKTSSVSADDVVNMIFANLKHYVDNVCDALSSESLSLKEKYDAVRDADIVAEVTSLKVMGGFDGKHDDADEDLFSEFRIKAGVLGALLSFVKPFVPKFNMPSHYGDYSRIYEIDQDIRDVFLIDFDRHIECLRDNAGPVTAYAQLIKLVDKYYAELKASVHGSDFADQEYGAYEVLGNREAQEYYREKFIEIYIDEYQDNSELQDAIISRFSRSEGNVFRVGDVKQSIYKFRSADPTMFLERLAGKKGGAVKFLKDNHRSSAEVVDLVNYVFAQVMTHAGAEIEYDEGQRLNWSEHTGHSAIPRLVIADRNAEFWNDRRENIESTDEEENTSSGQRLNLALCFGVLGEINRYMEVEGHELKDIMVLSKKVSKCRMIADFLNAHGVDATADNHTLVFEDMDVQSIISLIIVLGNEYRDDYLVSVLLRGFEFTNFTLDEIAQVNAYIKTDYGEYMSVNLMARIRKFCECAEDSDLKRRMDHFLDVFDDMRMTCRISDIDDLVDMIYDKTSILANVHSDSDQGANKMAILKDWLTSCFKRYGTDIGSIASLLEDMRIKINSAVKYDVKNTGLDAVRCMSIHKSKGLESPFVILAFDDTAEQSDSSSRITLDKKTGFIADNFDVDRIVLENSASRVAYNKDKKRAENAEAMRLLYVALTRAQQNLSMVTTADFDGNKVKFINDAADEAVFCDAPSFDSDSWLRGNAKLGYILMTALYRASCAAPLRDLLADKPEPVRVDDYNGFEVVLYDSDALRDILSKRPVIVQEESGADTDDGTPSEEGREYGEYAYDRSIAIPFKVAVTGINDWDISTATHVDLAVHDKEDYIDKLAGKVTAAGKGTIVHLIMQWADPEEYRKGREALLANVAELADSGVFGSYLKEDVLSVADEFSDGICSFAYTGTGVAMQKADNDGRAEYEKPIVFAVPAYEGAEEDDFVLVQGIIDAVYYEDDGAVVVDYKTDNYGEVTEKEASDKAREAHAFQIGCYAAALEASGTTVKAKYLYLVRYGMMVEV